MDGNVFLPLEKRNGQFHGSGTVTNERGCTRDSFDLSLDLSLSLVPLESRFQFNADPSASLKLDRFFVRAIVGSFVRSFLEPRQARLETLLVRRCTPAVGGWQFREADSANEKLVGFDIQGVGEEGEKRRLE